MNDSLIVTKVLIKKGKTDTEDVKKFHMVYSNQYDDLKEIEKFAFYNKVDKENIKFFGGNE